MRWNILSDLIPFLTYWIIFAADQGSGKDLMKSPLLEKKHKRSPQNYYGNPNIASPSGTCGTIVRNMEGWLYSPKYPSSYGYNNLCIYEIRRYSNDICEVQLMFMDFELEDSYGCMNDYLTLGNGAKGQRICGALATGTTKILPFPLDSHSIVLMFKSDARISYKGFNIQVKQIPNSCYRQNDNGNSRYCDRVVNGYKGKITSPNYPYAYGLNSRCTYTIYKADRSVCLVELEFVRFHLGYSGSYCMNDYLQLPGEKICKPLATKKTIPFPTNADYVKLHFFSGGYSSGRGFEIHINQIPASCRTNPPVVPNRSCNRIISGLRADMVSPGYPGIFQPNQHCLYTLYLANPSVCKIELDFRYFDLGHRGGPCSRSFLEFPDHDRICQSFTGRRLLDISRLGNPVEFGFYSGPYESARGFEIVIHQLVNSCGTYRAALLPSRQSESRNCDQQIVTYFGTLYSPPYTSNVNCVYVIKKVDPLICAVQIKFSRFKVGTPSGVCLNDYLELPDRNRLCGSVSGSRILPFLPGNQFMVLTFHSGASNYNDFELKVIQQRDSCPSGSTQLGRFVRSLHNEENNIEKHSLV